MRPLTAEPTDDIAGAEGDYAVPTLASLGLPEPTTSIHGGEAQALERLDAFIADRSRVATFSKPMTAPTSLEPSTTLLSPYLKFGCLSVREFYWRSKDVIDTYQPQKGEKVTKEPENILGQVRAAASDEGGVYLNDFLPSPQLEFREMYYCAEFGTAHYDRIRGSSLSR